jgi:hypothetical protein
MSKASTYRKIFLLGILIRLLLMPFFAHGDIIAVHRRVEQVVCRGKSFLSYGPEAGVHAIESLSSKITSPVIPCSTLSGIVDSFYNAPYLNRMLFFFKLPYLLFEILYWLVMWKIFVKEDDKKKRQITLFLALNPVMIYAVYIFGRFETYQIFFSAAVLFILSQAQKIKLKDFVLVCASMALIFTIRESYLLILPALAAAFGGFSLLGLASVGTAGGFLLFSRLIQKFSGQTSNVISELGWMQTGAHPNYIFEMSLNVGGGLLVYVFLLLVGIAFTWWLERREQLKRFEKAELFSLFSVLILLAYFGTSIFHPQYLTWFLPFFLYLMVKEKGNFLWASFWLAIPFYFVYILFWGNHVTFGTLFPVSTAFKQIEPGWFLPIYPTLKWASIGRSIFSAFCFYWFFYLIRKYDKAA